jgi:glycosyltransferase involved in cell wall biosynthesis
MKHELSILIPVYNTVCTGIVERLSMQCQRIAADDGSFRYEIIVADDASPRKDCIEANKSIGAMPNCRYIVKAENTGSAATRNFLAREARYEWLLFLDCDMEIVHPGFIRRYLDTEAVGVINGGISIGNGCSQNLRFLYEKESEPFHTAEQRRRRPYQSFRSTNFIIERKSMLACPFDERFTRSGYEDVMLGKELRRHNIPITHIDNPTLMTDFETNPDYIAKIERSLHTLFRFREELRGYSRLLTLVDGIHVGVVKTAIRLWHRLFGTLERRNLCGRRPSLTVFKLYRLGYYLNLEVRGER